MGKRGEKAVNDAPCRDCASRTVGCHAGYERYKAYVGGVSDGDRARAETEEE